MLKNCNIQQVEVYGPVRVDTGSEIELYSKMIPLKKPLVHSKTKIAIELKT